jgi:hypothetical protein
MRLLAVIGLTPMTGSPGQMIVNSTEAVCDGVAQALQKADPGTLG